MGPAVALDQQRRTFPRRAFVVPVARRIVEGVRGLSVRGLERDRPRRRETSCVDRELPRLPQPGDLATVRIQGQEATGKVRRGGHHHHLPAGSLDVATFHLGIRGLDRGQALAPSVQLRQPRAALLHVPADEPSGRLEGVGSRAQAPRRHPELGLHRRHRLALSAAPPVQVPPAAAVGDEIEHAVGRPFRLEHRLAAAAGDHPRRADRAIGKQVRHPQLGLVPGHVRMIPRQPSQPGTVGADRRIAAEVATFDQHLTGAAGRQVQCHDGVDRLAPRHAMVLAHAHQAAPAAVHHPVAETQVAPFRSDRHRRRARLLPVHPLVGEVGEPHHAVRDPEAEPAVLVHPGTHVERRRGHVVHGAVQGAAHDHVAAAVGGTRLHPVHVVAVELDRPQAHRVLDDQIGGDGRLPRTVGCDGRHLHAPVTCRSRSKNARLRGVSMVQLTGTFW